MREPGRIPGLDGVRAVCVVLVFVEHFVFGGHHLGGLGVKVFFSLSGYLIIGILHRQRLKVDRGASTVIDEITLFWRSRVLRIFPIYYIVLLGILAYSIYMGLGATYQGLPYYAVFLGNFYIEHISHAWEGFSHLWSISVEQHFYMVISLLLFLVPARQHLSLTLVMLGGSVIFAAYGFIHWKDLPQPYLADLPFFAFMAAGGVLAIRSEIVQRVPAIAVTGLFATSCAALVIASTPLAMGIFTEAGAVPCLLWVGMLGICFATLAYIPRASGSAIVRLLEFRPIRYLGTISYGFYVYHYFLPDLPIHTGWLPFFPTSVAFGLLALVQFAATCLVASVSWHLIERPLLGFKRYQAQWNKISTAA